jgi:hypothetical protein
VREKFSKRHLEIDQKTSELLTREPTKASGNIAEIRENIAHNERSRKMRDIGASKLRELWGSQLSERERQALTSSVGVARETPRDVEQASASESRAEEHLSTADQSCANTNCGDMRWTSRGAISMSRG